MEAREGEETRLSRGEERGQDCVEARGGGGDTIEWKGGRSQEMHEEGRRWGVEEERGLSMVDF